MEYLTEEQRSKLTDDQKRIIELGESQIQLAKMLVTVTKDILALSNRIQALENGFVKVRENGE